MRITKDQLVNGIIKYVESNLIPKIESRAKKILVDVGVKSIKGNSKLIDSILENQIIKTFINSDKDGAFDLEEIFKNLSESIDQYGPYPLVIPAIPIFAPYEDEFSLTADDISDLKKQIERSL